MDNREVVIKDGKLFLSMVFGANRWELEEVGGMSDYGQGLVTKLNSTIYYLLKSWKRMHGVDRELAEAALTMDIAEVKRCGYSVVGSMDYGRSPGGGAGGNYNLVVKFAKDDMSLS